MPSITAEINPRHIIWTSFEAEAHKPMEHPVPAASTIPIPPDSSYYMRINQLDSGEPVAAVSAVICEERASSTSSTCNSSGSGSTGADCYYQTTPDETDECLLVPVVPEQPTPILKIIGGKYKGKMCTVLRHTPKMVEIQILGDTRTRRIMKTSLLWD